MLTYLLINFFTIIFPLLFSFDKKIRFYKNWRFLFPAILIASTVMIVWDLFFTGLGVWNFNSDYITGIILFKLPIEEILFFISIPYACIFIYEYIRFYTPVIIKPWIVRVLSLLLIIGLAFFILKFNDRLYSSVTAIFCIFLLIQHGVIFRKKWLGFFYQSYLLSLIPFLIINGILSSLPVVIYNSENFSGIRFFSIPFEDTIYLMVLLLLYTSLYEFFKRIFGTVKIEEQEESDEQDDS